MNTNHHRLFAIFLTVAVGNAALTYGDVVVIGSSRDNTIYAESGTDLSNGSGEFMFAGTNGAGIDRRALVLFDLSAIPAGAVIQNVTLTLFMSQSSAGDVNVDLNRLLSDWGESTSNAPGGEGAGTAAAVGDATWDHTFFPGSFWNAEGGDFSAIVSGSQTVGGVGTYQWSSPGMVADVQTWLDGGFPNYGWALIGDSSTFPTAKRFDTRENVSGSPTLTVAFSVIPEPSTTALLLILVPGIVLRRNRKRAS